VLDYIPFPVFTHTTGVTHFQVLTCYPFSAVDNGTYEAYVREKEAARQEYMEAVEQGRTAGHVAMR